MKSWREAGTRTGGASSLLLFNLLMHLLDPAEEEEEEDGWLMRASHQHSERKERNKG